MNDHELMNLWQGRYFEALVELRKINIGAQRLRRKLEVAKSKLRHGGLDAENSRLRADLHRIRNDSLVWAMTCPHDCPACDAMYEAIKGAAP